MTDTDYQYSTSGSGLMRCCLDTIDMHMLQRMENKQGLPPDKHIIECPYCKSNIIYKDAAWQWKDK